MNEFTEKFWSTVEDNLGQYWVVDHKEDNKEMLFVIEWDEKLQLPIPHAFSTEQERIQFLEERKRMSDLQV